MNNGINRAWMAIVLRGIAAILIGMLTFKWPNVSVGALVILFGGFVMLDGLLEVLVSMRAKAGGSDWGAALMLGLVEVILGLLIIMWPGMTARVVLLFIGAWAIIRGVLELYAAIQLRKMIAGEALLATVGVLSILFGVIVFARPEIAAIGILWTIGVYLIVSGVLLVLLGMRMRRTLKAADATPA